ncbi:hypothetical protein EC9_24250 [Rosistilla ulvae]|uniref:Uncharacterized protein n=1 Tax=Rosistilla ulvae TaxID=1930277 RepID=A0A517M034_9BACT|nr:hypothetical protein [Rosistilla ulvae]QDS88237.1 hypothetical protein EC9_24250 [Rosistilla ulvae]
MKKPATTKRRPFRIESLETRSMLASDGLSLDAGLIDHPARSLGTVDVRIADSVMTYEVFAARGFRSVPPSDARPDWHGNPQDAGPRDNVAGPQFTFVALPELRARLLQETQSSPNSPVKLQFDWHDSLWSGSMSIDSPGSKPLPVHVDPAPGSSDVTPDDSMPDLSAGSDGDSSSGSDEGGLHLGSEPSTATAPQTIDEASNSETLASIDQALLELADDNVDEVVDADASLIGREAATGETATWSESIRQRAATSSTGQRSFADDLRQIDAALLADLSGDLDSQFNELQTRRSWNAGSDRYGDALDRWIVQNSDLAQQLTRAVQNEMIDLTADTSSDLVGMSLSYGGLKMTQLFVEADGSGPADAEAESPSQIGLVFESMATHTRLASAVGVIAVASCLALRRRTEQPLGALPKP